MRPRAWVLTASPRRAIASAVLTVVALTLPLLAILVDMGGRDGRWAVAALGFVYAGLIGGLVGAALLRPGGGDWRRRLGREVVTAVLCIVAIWVGVALANSVVVSAAASSLGAEMLDRLSVEGIEPVFTRLLVALILAGFVPPGVVLGYGIGRFGALAWPGWDRLRRTRLLWALTHAQIVASLALAVCIAAVLAFTGYTFIEQGRNPLLIQTGGLTLVARVIIYVLPAATVLLLASVGVLVVVLPPVALISFVVLRSTTRRLEDLTVATSALRAGDLTARVVVGGEDEVARLQADFNAMAADLERAMEALRADRDTVARLMAARRELVAAVSHELSTPVATVRGYLESARAHWADAPPPTLRADLAVMEREIERLQRLIEDLFALSRVEVGQLPLAIEPTAIGALLRRCAAAAAPLAWERGRVEVVVEVAHDLPPARVDPDRLEQIVRNLVANAVRHTPPGGLVLLAATGADDGLLVQVRDTGEGIAPEDLPRLFEPFYRADAARARDRGGAGLGLALVKELTEAMGGSVTVESRIGEGSTFTLRLPAATVGEAVPAAR